MHRTSKIHHVIVFLDSFNLFSKTFPDRRAARSAAAAHAAAAAATAAAVAVAEAVAAVPQELQVDVNCRRC